MTAKKKQEITITYGKEIQLVRSGEKRQEVFVKFSTTFREKQLRELKGAKLSVFLCYALHSDEQGYTWIDHRTIMKETGYSNEQIIKAKKYLKENGYLYATRLVNEKGQVKDWLYRIFQPIEPDKELIIRGEKLKVLHTEKTYIGKNPILEKIGGVIEEEPNNIKEEPNNILSSEKNSDDEFSFKEKLKKMIENEKRKDIQIIGWYWKWKGYEFENKEQYQAALKRELKAAKLLKGYEKKDILETFKYLDRELKGIKWTLETVWKFIDDIKAGKKKKLTDEDLIKLEYGTEEEKRSVLSRIKNKYET